MANVPEQARQLLHLEMLNRGFYLARRGYISLSVVLVDSDLDLMVDAFADFLDGHGAVLAA